MELVRTFSAIIAGVAGVAVGFLAIYLAEYAPTDPKDKGDFLIASAIASAIWFVAVVTFAICEYRSKAADKVRLEKTIRDVLRGEKIFDSRNRTLADAVRMSDQLSLLIAESEIAMKSRFRAECGEPPWGEGNDPIIKAIIDSESLKVVEEFNLNYLDRVRSVFASPEARTLERSTYLLSVLEHGARNAGDIHTAHSELDGFARQLIHGI